MILNTILNFLTHLGDIWYIRQIYSVEMFDQWCKSHLNPALPTAQERAFWKHFFSTASSSTSRLPDVRKILKDIKKSLKNETLCINSVLQMIQDMGHSPEEAESLLTILMTSERFTAKTVDSLFDIWKKFKLAQPLCRVDVGGQQTKTFPRNEMINRSLEIEKNLFDSTLLNCLDVRTDKNSAEKPLLVAKRREYQQQVIKNLVDAYDTTPPLSTFSHFVQQKPVLPPPPFIVDIDEEEQDDNLPLSSSIPVHTEKKNIPVHTVKKTKRKTPVSLPQLA